MNGHYQVPYLFYKGFENIFNFCYLKSYEGAEITISAGGPDPLECLAECRTLLSFQPCECPTSSHRSGQILKPLGIPEFRNDTRKMRVAFALRWRAQTKMHTKQNETP